MNGNNHVHHLHQPQRLQVFSQQRRNQNGKPRYYFAKEHKGEPIDKVSQGYEIEERINGIVSLVKSHPKLIPYEEGVCVENALARHPKARNYRIAVKNDQIIIYEGIGG